MSEDDLRALYALATGQGEWAWTGPNMHTYPSADQNQDLIHAGCLELERRGLLRRAINDGHFVMWEGAQ